MLLSVMTFVGIGVLFSLISYNFQVAQQTNSQIINLSKAIHQSDIERGNQTEKLINKTIEGSNRNYQLLVERANATNARNNQTDLIFQKLLEGLGNTTANLTNQHHILIDTFKPNNSIISRQINTSNTVLEIDHKLDRLITKK
jgi:hypothetical protein